MGGVDARLARTAGKDSAFPAGTLLIDRACGNRGGCGIHEDANNYVPLSPTGFLTRSSSPIASRRPEK